MKTQTARSLALATAIALTGAATLAACQGSSEPAELPADDIAEIATEMPTDVPEPSAVIIAENRLVDVGECTTLEWQTEQVIKAYLDGRGVELSGSSQVCPEETTTYTLVAVRADGTEVQRTVTVEVDVPEATPTETSEPTETTVPVTKPPPPTATPTITPTAEVHVEFWPDNGVLELPRDQKCTSVNWKTSGVSDVELEREGLGRKPVGPVGREEACYTARQKYYLYYKLPDGREERMEMELRHKN